MKSLGSARELAQSLVSTGRRMSLPTTALLTDMSQPLGRMVGNAVEVNESIDALRSAGPADLMEVTLELGAEALVLAKRESTLTAGRARLKRAIESGAGLEKLREMVHAQGGILDVARPVAPASEVLSSRAGIVSAIDTQQLGQVIIELGGGRKRLGDKLDHAVGLEMLVRLGDEVEPGQALALIFAKPDAAAKVHAQVLAAITVSDFRVDPPPLIVERIEGNSNLRKVV
jgi:thymidine phosphorylase